MVGGAGNGSGGVARWLGHPGGARVESLFDGAYRIDGFSQVLKLILIGVLIVLVLVGGDLKDVREDIRGEYRFLLVMSAVGFVLVTSCMDVLALVVSVGGLLAAHRLPERVPAQAT